MRDRSEELRAADAEAEKSRIEGGSRYKAAQEMLERLEKEKIENYTL